MPAYVDHDKRRQELAEAAADLISHGGVEAATVRAVAKAAGYSTKAVSHYFADKRALMLLTYRYAAERSRLITEASQPAEGADAAAFMHALLPTNEAIRRNWRVWFAFWGLAVADPDLAAEQRVKVRDVEDRITATLAADPRYARLTENERRYRASRLFSTVLGIALQAVFDPEGWPETRQTAQLAEVLNDPKRKEQGEA